MKIQQSNGRIAGRRTLLASALTLALSFDSASAATFVWDGGAGTNDLAATSNWNPNGSPSGSTSDILRWDGSVAGDLTLAYTELNPALNTAAGVSINVTAGQTSALQIDGGADPIRLNGSGNAPNQSPATFNRSGNNILSNTLTVNSGGSYSAIRSESGTLTFTAATSIISAATGFRAIQFTGDGDTIINGAITNGNSSGLTIEKSGFGTLTIGGNSTYTGATTISFGRFFVNGSLGNTAVSVTSGGRLGGDGSIAGMVTVSGSGFLQPGTGIGSLATNALTMTSGSRFEYEMLNGSATGADLPAVNGPLTLTDAGLRLPYDSVADPSWVWGDKVTLLSYKFSGTELTSGFRFFHRRHPHRLRDE